MRTRGSVDGALATGARDTTTGALATGARDVTTATAAGGTPGAAGPADAWWIEPLVEAPLRAPRIPLTRTRGGALPPALSWRYGADLEIALRTDRPTIVANFVGTIDGVVAFDTEGRSGGREVSGASVPDRFLMGLLRATADAVLVGAGTVRSGDHHVWTPGYLYPPAAAAYAAWRERLGLRRQPTTVIVTAAGRIDPGHPGLRVPGVPVLLATTPAGAARLRGRDLPAAVEVIVVGEGDRVDLAALVEVLAARGVDLILCEGGPSLFGELVAAGLVDELFLTLSPQLAGRAPDRPRLSLVEGVGFAIGAAPWAELASVMRSGDHLFLRYRLAAPARPAGTDRPAAPARLATSSGHPGGAA